MSQTKGDRTLTWEPGALWLLFPVSFSHPSEGSNAHPALVGWDGWAEHHMSPGRDVVQGAGDRSVKAAGRAPRLAWEGGRECF